MKLDFSSTNYKSKVTGWRISIENKADTLFPAVCDTARGIAGIAAAVDLTQLEHHDPQILARANLASDDEDRAVDEKDNIQAIDEDHGDKFDEHHDNGVDDGNNSGVDEDHNDGDDDSNGHDNEGDNSNGYDNEVDKGIGSGEDVDNRKASLSYRGPNSNNGDNDNDETEEKNYVDGAHGSDLTDISSSSDINIVEVAPASGSRRKGIHRGRH